MSTLSGPVSDPDVLRSARRLRALCRSLEALLYVVVAGSVLAIGSVHPWVYVPLWFAALAAAALVALRAATARSLRRRLGPLPFALDASGRSIVLDPRPAPVPQGWRFALDRPLLPDAPLLLPGLVFLVWVLLQLVPLPPGLVALLSPGRAGLVSAEAGAWRPLTLSPLDTLRGLAFVSSALLLHVAAATAFQSREARGRFLRFLSGLGLALAMVALAQQAARARRIYGFFEPLEGGAAIFGPFVNRNHFAGYMLLIIPMALSVLGHYWRRYGWRVGDQPNLRRRLVALQSPEGTALIYASIPVMATVAALLATTSRGGLLAFAGSLAVAGLALRRRGGAPAWIPALLFAGMALSWFGLERLEYRFARVSGDSLTRTVVWKDSFERMRGLWAVGSGFNTFATAMSRATPWALPAGATPWPPGLEALTAPGSRAVIRIPAASTGLLWYREAHNDYLQVLVETGLPGLLVALWGAAAVLRAARRDPWLLAALAGVLMHVFVDFDLQIPAIAVLFVCLAALGPEEAATS